MAGNKMFDKLKENVSFRDIDGFSRKYSTEIFAAVSLAVAAISSSFDFFTGPKLSIFIFVLGSIAGIFFTEPVKAMTKKMWGLFNKQEKTTQLVILGGKVAVAIFVPFILLGVFGLFAGLSFHHYASYYEDGERNSKRSQKNFSGDEHD